MLRHPEDRYIFVVWGLGSGIPVGCHQARSTFSLSLSPLAVSSLHPHILPFVFLPTKSPRLFWSLTSCLNWFSEEESRDGANSGGNLVSVRTGKLQTAVSPSVTWSPVETFSKETPSTPVQVPGREVNKSQKPSSSTTPARGQEHPSTPIKILHAGHLPPYPI